MTTVPCCKCGHDFIPRLAVVSMSGWTCGRCQAIEDQNKAAKTEAVTLTAELDELRKRVAFLETIPARLIEEAAKLPLGAVLTIRGDTMSHFNAIVWAARLFAEHACRPGVTLRGEGEEVSDG